ncbi:hypothetical protein [Actinomycetospora flava]|uniref:Uncharacterized protein n=1 Tax=Actinomycetospora flava TaxID=3129232 RepID=A0ABU8LYE3_9PSEU
MADVVVRLGDACFAQARALAEATVRRRILAERRRARREAGLDRPWWGR